MILKTSTLVLILSMTWVNYVHGAPYSNVYVQSGSEVLPIEYFQYESPSYPIAGQYAQLSASNLVPVSTYVSPCGSSCFYPGQEVAPVPQLSSAPANLVAYNSPVSSLPVLPRESTGYQYSYVVYDEHTGDHKAQREHSDGSVVRGEYSFIQPDGYVRDVQYVADDLNGFNAIVKNYLPAIVREVKVVEVNNEPFVEVQEIIENDTHEPVIEFRSSHHSEHGHNEHSEGAHNEHTEHTHHEGGHNEHSERAHYEHTELAHHEGGHNEQSERAHHEHTELAHHEGGHNEHSERAHHEGGHNEHSERAHHEHTELPHHEVGHNEHSERAHHEHTELAHHEGGHNKHSEEAHHEHSELHHENGHHENSEGAHHIEVIEIVNCDHEETQDSHPGESHNAHLEESHHADIDEKDTKSSEEEDDEEESKENHQVHKGAHHDNSEHNKNKADAHDSHHQHHEGGEHHGHPEGHHKPEERSHHGHTDVVLIENESHPEHTETAHHSTHEESKTKVLYVGEANEVPSAHNADNLHFKSSPTYVILNKPC